MFVSSHAYSFLLKLHNYFQLYLSGYGNREKERQRETISYLYGRTGNMGAPFKLLQVGIMNQPYGHYPGASYK